MNIKRFLIIIPVVFLIHFIFLMVNDKKARAIPAFARKYNISCITCHTPSIPKLKPYGDSYAGDGFKLTEYQAPRYFVETGDQKLSLLRNLPVAVRMDGYLQARVAENGKTDLSAPYLIKLLSGGQLSEHFSYYFYFYLSEHGEVAGVEDAYLMYDRLFNTGIDVVLGQFQVSDPLFKRELRLTFEDYHLYTSQIGVSDITMKYDRGVMVTYGLPTSTDLVFMMVNGNGLSEAGENRLFDKDPHKSFLGRISQSAGDYLRVGVVGYYGREDLIHPAEQTITNAAAYMGADATISIADKMEINMQYLFRNDDQVYLSASDATTVNNIHTHGLLGELIYSPNGDQSDWYAVGLYNYVNSGFNPADYHSATLHVGYLIRRNIRLGAEYTQIFTDPENQVSRFSLGFTSAF